MSKKKPVYTVWYKKTGTYEAKIEASSFEEALELALEMSTAQLDAAPGDIVEEDHKLTGVFE